jgi:hypothetical protein
MPSAARSRSQPADATHDLWINRPRMLEGYWDLSDSEQDRKRPSLLRIPTVPIETNGLSTVCLQWGEHVRTSNFTDLARMLGVIRIVTGGGLLQDVP